MEALKRFLNQPSLTHLKRLTTQVGLIQHADNEVPDPSFGYSIDDNARALIVCLQYFQLFNDPSVLQLADIYFSYIQRAQKEGGSFHNFISYTEQKLDDEGSDDAVARTIWALSYAATIQPKPEKKQAAKELFNRTENEHHELHEHIHTRAYTLLAFAQLEDTAMVKKWADQLISMYTANSEPDWQWFENSLRYANGILPYALARAFKITQDATYLKTAKESFDWLNEQSMINGVPSPIGQDGWYEKGQKKAIYDQQPLEAADMVLAATELYQATKDESYLKTALNWMNWYEGNNMAKISLISPTSKGVYDAIIPSGVNQNQGAESIVTYLLAWLSLSEIAKKYG